MSRREIVWRSTGGALALFCYVMAIVSAGRPAIAVTYALLFAGLAWLATDDVVAGL